VDQDFSPVQHTIVLRRVDPESNAAQFYMLTIERDLFGNVVVTRQWGRVGTAGRQITDPYPTEEAAVEAMTALAAAKAKARVLGPIEAAPKLPWQLVRPPRRMAW
jgi:predicted DNA-binding WGR domain protein